MAETWSWADVPDLKYQPPSRKYISNGKKPGPATSTEPYKRQWDTIEIDPKLAGGRHPLMAALADSITYADAFHIVEDKHLVCWSTLLNWRTGKTRAPNIDRLSKVANAMEARIVIGTGGDN